MIEREFEDYLALLRGLLRLRKTQCDAIADELRDHMDARLEDLLAEGIPREKAVQIALEEFGDAAGVGQAFLELNRNNQRRWNMKVTAASLISCTALGLAAMAFWPDNAPQVSNPVMAQAGGGLEGGQAGPGGMPGMPPQQHVRTKEENNAITAEMLSRVSTEGIEIDNMQLTEVVHEIRDAIRGELNVIFDKQKLEEGGVDTTSPINFRLLRGVRYDTMLELILNSVNAGYYIHDGIVIISSKDAIAAVTEVRVYNVADLVYLDTRWPLDPHQGGPSGSGGPGMMPGGMGMPGMGHPGASGGMGPGGMGPSGMGHGGGGKPGGPPGGFGGPPGGIGGVGGPPGGIGGVGGPPGGIGGLGGVGGPPGGIGGAGGPPGGIGGVGGGPPPGGKGGVGGPPGGASGKGGPGAGGGVPGSGGVPGGPPGSGGPGLPGAPGGSGAGISTPDEASGNAEGASGLGALESILTSPAQFLAQMGGGGGMMMGGPGGMAGGAGSGGEGGGSAMMGGGMGGMGGGLSAPKYFSKSPENYTPEERRTVDLIDAIIASVEPESWMATGDGIGEIRPFEGLIVIRNTPKAHQGVEQLLEQIRAARHMQQGGGLGGGPGGGGFFSIDGK